VVTTDHSAYDIEFIAEHAKTIVDTRNITKKLNNNKHKVTKLGAGSLF